MISRIQSIDRGQYYLLKPKAEVWIILDIIIIIIMRKSNPIIVLLYIQNSHTKMQAKCGRKETHASNLANFVIL